MKRILYQYDLLSPANARNVMYGDYRLSSCSELAYLSHFIGCYRPSLQLAGLQHYPIYILEDEMQRLGISFFGPQLSERKFSPIVADEISSLKEHWLVLAPDCFSGHENHLASFLSSHHSEYGFDAIFLFDYSQSTIQIIK